MNMSNKVHTRLSRIRYWCVSKALPFDPTLVPDKVCNMGHNTGYHLYVTNPKIHRLMIDKFPTPRTSVFSNIWRVYEGKR